MKSLAVLLVLSVVVPAARGQDDKYLGKTADAWAHQLKTGDAKQRRRAAFALGSMGNRAAAVAEAMKAALKDEKDAPAREALAYAFGEIGRQSLNVGNDVDLQHQLAALVTGDGDPLVRRSAACALGLIGSRLPATRTALAAALEDGQPIVRQNAAWALGQLGEDSLPLLKKALADTDPLVRRDAAGTILQMHDGDKVRAAVLDDLLPLAKDEYSEVRRAAVSILVKIVDRDDAKAVAPLLTAMESDDVEIRRNAAMALSNIGGRDAARAEPILLEALRDGDIALRRQAALALRNLGPDAAGAVPDLVKVLKFDPDAELRTNAALALGGIGPAAEAAVPALVDLVLDGTQGGEMRQQGANALRLIGPVRAAEDALPKLVDLIGDARQDGRVRLRVLYTVWRHQIALPNLVGAYDTIGRVLTEPVREDNVLLRYNCACTLGLFWRDKTDDRTLDTLLAFLRDASTKIIERTRSTVGGTGTETASGTATVNEVLRGDGRMMAVEALKAIGPERVRRRPDIVRQLQALADDATVFPDLRTEAGKLAKQAR